MTSNNEKLNDLNPEEWAELDYLIENYESDSVAFYKNDYSRATFVRLHNKLLPKKAMKYAYPDCVNRAYFNLKNYNNGI